MRKRLIALLAIVAIVAAACGGSDGSEDDSLSPERAGEYFTNIDTLLGQMVAEHAEGNSEEAAELAGQAYLDNYEHLEHDLEEVDEELNEEIEELLGPSLRQAIQDGMSQEDLEARVVEVTTLLQEARAALEVA